jgi:ABC-type Fe3+-hydroxamate transport system substrate-binding protein
LRASTLSWKNAHRRGNAKHHQLTNTSFVDAVGQGHPRADTNARIVSLVPSITELLFDLGLGPQVVGRTTFCIHPAPAVERVTRIGGTKTVNFDRLGALNATHIIVNIDENLRDDVPRLEALGVQVVVTHPMHPGDNVDLFRLLGGVFGASERAEALVGEFEDALALLKSRQESREPREVLYLIWRDPWMCVSRDTYISRVLELVGLQTVPSSHDARYPTVAAADEVWRHADVILLSSEPYPFKERHVEEIRQLTGERNVPVQFIDGEMTSWYGSRAIRGLQYLLSFELQ